MSRWLGILRKDCNELEQYAVAYATHTVSKVLVNGVPVFSAWRLDSPATLLGAADSETGAKLICEENARK